MIWLAVRAPRQERIAIATIGAAGGEPDRPAGENGRTVYPASAALAALLEVEMQRVVGVLADHRRTLASADARASGGLPGIRGVSR